MARTKNPDNSLVAEPDPHVSPLEDAEKKKELGKEQAFAVAKIGSDKQKALDIARSNHEKIKQLKEEAKHRLAALREKEQFDDIIKSNSQTAANIVKEFDQMLDEMAAMQSAPSDDTATGNKIREKEPALKDVQEKIKHIDHKIEQKYSEIKQLAQQHIEVNTQVTAVNIDIVKVDQGLKSLNRRAAQAKVVVVNLGEHMQAILDDIEISPEGSVKEVGDKINAAWATEVKKAELALDEIDEQLADMGKESLDLKAAIACTHDPEKLRILQTSFERNKDQSDLLLEARFLKQLNLTGAYYASEFQGDLYIQKQNKVDRTQAYLKENSEKIKSAESALAALHQQKTQLDNKITALSKNIATSKIELTALESERALLKEQEQVLQSQLNELRDLEGQKKVLAGLQKALPGMQTGLERLEKQIQELEKNNPQSPQLQQKIKQRAKLMINIGDKQGKLSALDNDIKIKENTVQNLEQKEIDILNKLEGKKPGRLKSELPQKENETVTRQTSATKRTQLTYSFNQAKTKLPPFNSQTPSTALESKPEPLKKGPGRLGRH